MSHFVYEALEQQQIALAGIAQDVINPSLRRPGAARQEHLAWLDCVNVLARAESFYWGASCMELCRDLSKDFDLDTVISSRELLYCEEAFHYFEKPPFFTEIAGEMKPVRAITWAAGRVREGHEIHEAGAKVIFVDAWVPSVLPDHRLLPVLYSLRAFGNPMSGTEAERKSAFGDVIMEEMTNMLRFVVAASTFLRQKLLRSREEAPPRGLRKRIARERAPVRTDRIHVLQLRQAAPAAPGTVREFTEWSCQWTVRGHVRQQWYATINKHLPVWVHPYVKGPENMPLKPRTTSIYQVTR